MMDNFLDHSIILASASPRRKELLSKAGFQFKVITANIEETYPENLLSEQIAEYIAEQKAIAVASTITDKKAIIIAADTIVLHKNAILGKPKNKQEAYETLQHLSNTQHQVITGVCIKNATQIELFSATTQVYFSEVSEAEIEYYINNYEVMDKAGSYGIQDWIGLTKIDKIKGCYFNVMGLPMSLLYKKMSLFLNSVIDVNKKNR